MPMRLPSTGRWLLDIVAREGRFVFGVCRRHMKVIGYLGTLDRLLGVPATTRGWSTIMAIANVLHYDAPVGAGSSFGHRARERPAPVTVDAPVRRRLHPTRASREST